jgi:hypothetical protein
MKTSVHKSWALSLGSLILITACCGEFEKPELNDHSELTLSAAYSVAPNTYGLPDYQLSIINDTTAVLEFEENGQTYTIQYKLDQTDSLYTSKH